MMDGQNGGAGSVASAASAQELRTKFLADLRQTGVVDSIKVSCTAS